MPEPSPSIPRQYLNIDAVLPIVVGAHPAAELTDRPIAYRLRSRMEAWLSREGAADRFRPLVCTDLWYLNADDLRARPTVSVGGPGVNAFAAYLGDKLPSAYVVDDVLIVQFDVELADVAASCWGVDARATARAADAFADRYLDLFMRGAVGPA